MTLRDTTPWKLTVTRTYNGVSVNVVTHDEYHTEAFAVEEYVCQALEKAKRELAKRVR